MVPSKTHCGIVVSANFGQNTLFFSHEILLLCEFPFVRPSCKLGLLNDTDPASAGISESRRIWQIRFR